jgi:hypothetical protein
MHQRQRERVTNIAEIAGTWRSALPHAAGPAALAPRDFAKHRKSEINQARSRSSWQETQKAKSDAALGKCTRPTWPTHSAAGRRRAGPPASELLLQVGLVQLAQTDALRCLVKHRGLRPVLTAAGLDEYGGGATAVRTARLRIGVPEDVGPVEAPVPPIQKPRPISPSGSPAPWGGCWPRTATGGSPARRRGLGRATVRGRCRVGGPGRGARHGRRLNEMLPTSNFVLHGCEFLRIRLRLSWSATFDLPSKRQWRVASNRSYSRVLAPGSRPLFRTDFQSGKQNSLSSASASV